MIRSAIRFRFRLARIAALWLAAAPALAQQRSPDWHTRDFPGRNESIWKLFSRELKASFRGGGSPVADDPFLEDDRTIYPLDKAEIEEPIEADRDAAGALYVRARNGTFRVGPGGAERASHEFPERAGARVGGRTYSIRDGRLCRAGEGGERQPVLEFGRRGLPDSDVRALAVGPDGKLYVATASGLGVLSPEGEWSHLTGRRGGLPVDDATCISFCEGGAMWVGTKLGAARRNPDGSWNYRMGPRWMIGDEVRDIRGIENGGAIILTRESLTLLAPRRVTLREKAAIYDKITRERHVRYGAVGDCQFRRAGDLDSWFMTDNDNDGLWTSIYAAGKCFEFAATGDPEAKRAAKLHFDFLARLESITGIPGFIARSFRPDQFEKGSRESYNYKDKGEWHESPGEPGWQWKGDTSSDELSGHFFIWGVYYDLVAKGDPAEEARVQGLVRRVMSRLIENDYLFVGPSGAPTRWGVYSPRLMNGDLVWAEEANFISMCLLAHMKVAIHICGDEAFKEAYRELVEKHGYSARALKAKEFFTASSRGGVNHSDDEMAWLAYYHLLLYPDDDPNLRAQYRYSAVGSLRPVVAEKSPFHIFPFAVEFPDAAPVADGVDTLRRWPLDLRHWKTVNSKRDDVVADPRPNRFKMPVLIQPIPADERVPDKWNHDPYVPDEGDAGKTEEDGGSWLLPYWMGVYHKLIVDAAP